MATSKKTTKKGAKGAAKKAAKKSASKKVRAKKSSAKKSSAKKARGYVPSPGKCGGWRAIHNFQPGAPPVLTVTGKCVFPTTGFKVKLVKAVPQGINPLILLLRKVVTPPVGITIPVITTVPVEFKLKTATKYTHVTILPDNVTVKVQNVF